MISTDKENIYGVMFFCIKSCREELDEGYVTTLQEIKNKIRSIQKSARAHQISHIEECRSLQAVVKDLSAWGSNLPKDSSIHQQVDSLITCICKVQEIIQREQMIFEQCKFVSAETPFCMPISCPPHMANKATAQAVEEKEGATPLHRLRKFCASGDVDSAEKILKQLKKKSLEKKKGDLAIAIAYKKMADEKSLYDNKEGYKNYKKACEYADRSIHNLAKRADGDFLSIAAIYLKACSVYVLPYPKDLADASEKFIGALERISHQCILCLTKAFASTKMLSKKELHQILPLWKILAENLAVDPITSTFMRLKMDQVGNLLA